MKKYADEGFTLVEVMAVMIILAVLAAVAIPRLSSSTEIARKNADIATAHQVKTALDRYQVENGAYPTSAELTASEGAVSDADFIPKYISKLDTFTTQQKVAEGNKGFGVNTLPTDTGGGVSYPDPSNLIMIYVTDDGSAAEVRAYDSNLSQAHVLWSSTD